MTRPILRQKISRPATWVAALSRPHLEAELDRAIVAGQHVAIVAGTGYGKTTLLSGWSQTRQVAWFTLDAEDADLGVFLTYLVTVFERVLKGFRTEARGMLSRAREREGAQAALSALMADLDEQCDAPLVLVLDDYHLAASPSLDALLVRMFKYMPPNIRLIVVSRQQPEIELAALRASRLLHVLGEDDLAFQRAELHLLRPELTDAELAELEQKTGGWPAAMGLTPELLDAYLEEQVLGPLPVDLVELLERLALVDAFDTSLCEEALGVTLGLDRREWLLKQRLILQRDQRRFMLPPQLRDFLRRRLQASMPRHERLAILRAVGDHHWRLGQASTGLRFWIDAGEVAWAAERLNEVAEEWLSQGRLEALSSAIVALGPLAERPELLTIQGDLFRRWGDFDRAEALLERAVEAFPDDRAPARAVARLRQAQVAASCGKIELAKSRLEEALAGLGELGAMPRFQMDVLNLEGGLELLAGSTQQAIAHFEAALHLSRRLGDHYTQARSIHNLGVCYTRLGEFGRALACYDEAIRPVANDDTPPVWMTPINRALVLIYLDRAGEAALAAEAALDLVRRYKLTREEGYALRILGLSHLRADNLASARACFEAAELLARRTNDTLGVAYSLNFQAELAGRVGDRDTALRLAHDVETLMGGEERLRGIPEFALVRARVALACGQLAEAEELVTGLEERARASHYRQLLAETEELKQAIVRQRLDGTLPWAPSTAGREEPWELAIQCFGGLRVLRHGQEIGEREWQTARAKTLLAFLAHVPDGATKQRLFDAVYPEGDGSDASMNMTLMRLRKALEPGLERGQPSRYVLRSDGRYALNRQAHIQLDTTSFESLLKTGQSDSQHERDRLTRAIALYRGPFLPELDYEWVETMRNRFQELAVEACRRLLDLTESEEESLALLHRALEIDPLSEEFNRELILRYLEAEEPHRALQHYRLCERRYHEALNASPPADLAQLVNLA